MDIRIRNIGILIDDIKEFAKDMKKYLEANSASLNYQNTLECSETCENQTRLLLQRCNLILNLLESGSGNTQNTLAQCLDDCPDRSEGLFEENSYLEMSVLSNIAAPQSTSEYVTVDGSTNFEQHNASNPGELKSLSTNNSVKKDFISETNAYSDGNYDICNVLVNSNLDGKSIMNQQEESIMTNELQSFAEKQQGGSSFYSKFAIPAQKLLDIGRAKIGFLQLLEKRLFFEQARTLYCGIINDFLLCYDCDSSSSSVMFNTSTFPLSQSVVGNLEPTLCINIRSCQVEQYGDRKRHNLCFQITSSTIDVNSNWILTQSSVLNHSEAKSSPKAVVKKQTMSRKQNKKFIFLALNKIDATEWVHAIESAKSKGCFKNQTDSSLRKLPTPPLQCQELSRCFDTVAIQRGTFQNCSSDDIYEEPGEIYQPCGAQVGQILENKETSKNLEENYDIPRPLNKSEIPQNQAIEAAYLRKKRFLEFQIKAKAVEAKLSNHLSNPAHTSAKNLGATAAPSIGEGSRSHKSSRKTFSWSKSASSGPTWIKGRIAKFTMAGHKQNLLPTSKIEGNLNIEQQLSPVAKAPTCT